MRVNMTWSNMMLVNPFNQIWPNSAYIGVLLSCYMKKRNQVTLLQASSANLLLTFSCLPFLEHLLSFVTCDFDFVVPLDLSFFAIIWDVYASKNTAVKSAIDHWSCVCNNLWLLYLLGSIIISRCVIAYIFFFGIREKPNWQENLRL